MGLSHRASRAQLKVTHTFGSKPKSPATAGATSACPEAAYQTNSPSTFKLNWSLCRCVNVCRLEPSTQLETVASITVGRWPLFQRLKLLSIVEGVTRVPQPKSAAKTGQAGTFFSQPLLESQHLSIQAAHGRRFRVGPRYAGLGMSPCRPTASR